MSESELKELHDIFNDCWRLLKSTADVKPEPEWWDNLIASMSEIYHKHHKHPLSLAMTTMIGEYLDGQYKAQYKQ